jgi:hypothetical protein
MTDDAMAAAGKSRLFYRNLALERPQLFGAILGFNAAVNRDAAMARLGVVPEAILSSSNRARGRLQGRQTPGFWDFEEESRRMALVDTATLKDLILSWGAAFCAPLLNRYVLRQDVETLHREVDVRYLDFARGKGRFNIGDISGIIRLEETAVPAEKMPALIAQYGMHAHGTLATAWPESLQAIEARRIERHLPGLFVHRSRQAQVHPPHLRAIWFSMKKILLKEVAPQWTPCFS